MIRYNIPYQKPRQGGISGDTPGAGEILPRPSGPCAASQPSGVVSRPSAASLGAAMLLHLAAGLLLLGFVRLRATPPALDDQTVALVFAPAPAPHAVPPPVPTVAVVTQMAPPDPQAAPEAPVLIAIPPPPPETPSPIEASPRPAIPPPPPAVATLPPPIAALPRPPPIAGLPPPPPAVAALTPIPAPAYPPRPPPPKPRSATPPRTATVVSSGRPPPALERETAASSHKPPPAPKREATSSSAPSTPPPGPSPEAAPTHAVPPAPIPGDWQRALGDWLAAHKTYPEEARRRGAEGSVTVRFSVDRSGRVLDVALAGSAGASVLDAAAEAMLRGATLPPVPADMPQDTVTVTVRVRYTLTD